MKLKKIEITGFKSFVDKTRISFPNGISAIVGPNGCGKSNVVDALRWVMGEQSVKQLRGKSMEDIIFSGSDGRPPLNMAEVSLTLVNDNGSAPEELKDFSEIEITRRLYRSGERSYFLNKQPCRLKDINNIFLGSGMGAKSYAVIQQGNIGAITDAGPEERRFFIEEAAGVTRYKNRKIEALRKVKSTRHNLLRVTDIIAEVKRQMNSLKRQARKAEMFKKHRESIKDLDVLKSLIDHEEYRDKIEHTALVLKELKNTEFEHTSKLGKLDALIEEIQVDRTRKNMEISQQKSLKFETQRDTDRMENDLAHLKKDVERLTVEVEGLKAASKDLDEKNLKMKLEMQEVEKSRAGIQEEVGIQKELLEKENLLSQNLRAKLDQLNTELDTYKAQLMELVAKEAKYKNIYQNASNSKESLARRLKRTAEEEAIAKKKAVEFEKKEEQAKKILESFKQEIEELNSKIGAVREKLEEKSKALGQKVKLVQTMELERHKLKSRYNALKKMDDNFEWYKDGVKAIMKKGEGVVNQKIQPSSRLQNGNIMGIMADMIEPQPGFETAVEAVLGESLQYIIVKDQETGVDAIDYLRTSGAGRSGFIPVSSVKIKEQSASNDTQPSLPLLLDHVSIKDGFEDIAQAMFSDVAVVNDIQEAVTTWNSLYKSNGHYPKTIVTKEGNLISPKGIMLGGSKDKLSGILAKKHEIKELAGKVADLDKHLESEKTLQKALESSVRDNEIELQKQVEQKNNLTQDELEAQRAYYKTTENVKHALHHLEVVTLEHEQLLGEESDIDDQMSSYYNALAKIEQDVKQAQDNVTDRSSKIDSVSADLEEFNQKVVDIKLALTGLNAKFDNSSNTLRRLKAFYNDGIKQLEQLSLDIEAKIQKRASEKEKITEYDQNLSKMYDKFKELNQKLEISEEDFLAIESKLKQQDEIISTLQGKREKGLERLRYLEVEKSQLQIKLENIENRIEERYHQPLKLFRAQLAEKLKNLETSKEEMEENLTKLREKVARIGDVNLGAIEEYEELKTRDDFLTSQKDDLEQALEDLHTVIKKTNKITKELFLKTLGEINDKLKEVFPRLFDGGTAKLILTEPDNVLESGVEFMIHPPGKKLTRMSLLSGGEKALSAIAFIFSIFLLKPASFCLMDEIDAPLDDANVYRFNDLVKAIGEKSQIIMVTHNKRSMEFADILLGVTMQKKGVSQIVSVNLE